MDDQHSPLANEHRQQRRTSVDARLAFWARVGNEALRMAQHCLGNDEHEFGSTASDAVLKTILERFRDYTNSSLCAERRLAKAIDSCAGEDAYEDELAESAIEIVRTAFFALTQHEQGKGRWLDGDLVRYC